MAGRREGMVDVELDDEPDLPARPPHEGDGPAPHHPEHLGAPAPAAGRARRGRILRATAAVVAVGALAVTGLTLRDSAAVSADDARVHEAADLPGLVASLRSPLAERWRGPASVEVVGSVALTTELYQGTVRTVARDPATGALRWIVPRSLTPGNQPPACRPLAAAADALTCEIPGRVGIQAANTDEALGSTPGRLVTLDATTGAVVDLTVLPVGTAGWAVAGSDVVTAHVKGGELVVARTGPSTQREVWSTSITVPAAVLGRQLSLRVADGLVQLDGATAVVLDVSSGELLGTFAPGRPGSIALQLSSGRLGFTVWQGRTGTWHDRKGRAGATLTGMPVEAAIDDGSGGALLLVRDSSFVFAVDAVDGAPAWTRSPVDAAPLRLHGLLLIEGGGRLQAVDAETGATRWSAAAAAVADGVTPVCDGVRVLAVVPGEGDAPARITAFVLADGSVAWSVPMPAGTTTLSARDGAVVASGESATVVLG